MRIALPTMFRRDAPPPAPLPQWAPPLWRLAYLALGDDRSATVLVAEVLAQAPTHEGAAVKLLSQRLPEGWLSWPGAAGPSEWLRLRLRREQADRLLSVLGEWSGRERLALGLFLAWDVPLDDLDRWVGASGMAQAVSELITHAGHSLGVLRLPSDDPACVVHRAELLEAHERDAPPPLRQHLLGCAACRTYAAELRRTKDLVHRAINVFFRQAPPMHHLQAAAVVPRTPRRWTKTLVPVLAPLLAAALLAAAVIARPHRGAPVIAAQGPALTATDVLDRALDRFAQAPPTIFHERVRAGTNADAVVIDRWFDHYDRVRITVRSANNEPVLDISSDGQAEISYLATDRDGESMDALLEPPDLDALLPMVRQLPFVGSFGSLPVAQNDLDIALVAQSKRGTPTLLGTRRWNDRVGYLINSTADDGARLVLLVDAEQFNVLQAQWLLPNAAPHTVWQAEIVETPPSSPPGTWNAVSKHEAAYMFNPRHLFDEAAPLALVDVAESVTVPIPTALPDDALVRHLRELVGAPTGVLQLYESRWSTIALVTGRMRDSYRPPRPFTNRFAHGDYVVLEGTADQATFVAFAHDDLPDQRHAVYLWHALAPAEEREQMVVELLNSIELADHTNAAQYADRFAAPPPPTAAAQASAAERARIAALSPERRYLRLKLQQAGR